MKNFSIVLLSYLLLACGGNETEKQADFSNISFTIDTVMVDPGNGIINLKQGLWFSTFSEDKKHLYLWNNDLGSLDKINLDELILEESIQFEKEGPDGVGPYVSFISLVDKDRILMSNFVGMGIFDLTGKKISNHTIGNGNFSGESLNEGESFDRKIHGTEGGDVIYGFLGNMMNDEMSFARINFKTMEMKRIDLPGHGELPDYSLRIQTDEMNGEAPTDNHLQKVGNRIILSNSAYNTLYILELDKDSVYQVNYAPQLTAASKKGKYPKVVESNERFKEVMADIFSEINFQPPVWDDVNRRFYRFSYETVPGVRANSALFEDPEKRPLSKLFISVFDEDFNLIGESLVTQLEQVPNSVFVKDGKIWHYVNVEDELGFVRMEIK